MLMTGSVVSDISDAEIEEIVKRWPEPYAPVFARLVPKSLRF
jgi:hypothetical protein